MDSIDTQTWIIIGIAALIAAAIVAGWFFYLKQRTSKLKQHFGPEYGRTVDQLGDQAKAENELMARAKRVQKFHIVPLTPPEAARFNEAWKALQLRFVDDPQAAVAEADRLVHELMSKRGYPMGDFEHNAADISVDHPKVVENYRAAHAIAERDVRGEADTEELRKAVVHYRALFTDLLEVHESPSTPPPRPPHSQPTKVKT